jgi:ABC-2 type transport system permease protein
MSVSPAPIRGGRLARIGSIAWHECRTAWRSRTIQALGIVLALLLGAAATVGHARFSAESAQRQRYQTLVGEQFAAQPDRHPHRVSHYGYLLFRPRAPLGFFDTGLESFAGTSIFLEAHRQNTANFSVASQGGGNDRFGDLTLALVLQFFLPIFVLAVAGVSITREREAGTLPLLLCQGVKWSDVVWGKWCGTLLLLAAVVMPGAVLAAAWLAFAVDTTLARDVVLRAAGLVGVHALFLAACAAIGIAASAWHHTSRAALVTLIAAWFGLWVILPRVLPVVATAVEPVPVRATFDADVEARVMELGDSHNPDDPVFARLRESTLRQYGVTRVEDLPFNYDGLVMAKGEEATTAAYREHLAQLQAAYRRQQRLVEWAGIVSPYIAVRLASMALAGSDVAHLFEFERQAEDYRYRLIQGLNDLHQNQVSHSQEQYGAVVNGAPSRGRIDAAFFDRLPTFEYVIPDPGWALAGQRGALLAGAFGMAVIFGMLAWTARRGRL